MNITLLVAALCMGGQYQWMKEKCQKSVIQCLLKNQPPGPMKSDPLTSEMYKDREVMRCYLEYSK